ncbi:MAG: CDP-alcohol phosphatidyltransferase family protein [Gemmatimonadota bacterium]
MTPNLPNLITSVRAVVAPVVAYLLFQSALWSRLAAFLLFLSAALSDVWDGHLARSRGQITSFGKIVDPMADKLLLLTTLLPLYLLTVRHAELAGLPLFGAIPAWAVLVLLGREVLIATLRLAAARRGRVVGARGLAKRKTVAQNVFIGAAILWVAFRSAGYGGEGGLSALFREFHGWVTSGVLVIALVLTVLSMFLYLAAFRRIFAEGRP